MAANFFDQFDPASAKPEGGGKSGNYFDQFDPGSARPEPAGGTASDLAKSLKVGTQRLPGMVTGLADLPFALAAGARPFTKAADAMGEVTGFQPGKWADETKFSAGYEQGKKAVDDAWKDGSAGDIALAYLKNPGYTANQVVESAPGMVAGGLAGRALMGVGRVAAPAARAGGVGPAIPGLAERALGQWAAPVAAGVGEGAVTAGQQMAQYQGEDQQTNALAALGAGVVTGGLGVGAGRVANKLGLETAETAIAKAGTGAAKAADDVPLSAKRRILGGMVSEALLQELPQSAQEQMWQNWADGKPLMDGVARAATEGAIAGGVMGAGANVSDGGAGKRRTLAEQQAKQLSEAEAEALRADPSRAWTTEAGAVDPNQQAGERAAPPEAPELQTIPGAAGQRDGLDFTRDVDTAGLTLQDPAEMERARAATMDYEPTDATPQWDTQPGAAPVRSGLDMPAPEFDTGSLGIDTSPLSERMGLDTARGSLTRIAALAVDTGASPVQFLGATGRDMQLRQTGPGVANESNVIDVQGRVVEDRAIGAPSYIEAAQPGARQQPAGRQALPAPTNLREALDRIRQQRAEGERLASPSPAPGAAVPALGEPVGNDRAGSPANAVPDGLAARGAGGGGAAGTGRSLAAIGTAQSGGRGNGNPALTTEAPNAQTSTPSTAPRAQAVSAAGTAAGEAAGPATIPATTGVARESQASQTQQGSPQSTQAGGPQAGAATATASTVPAGGNRVQAAGLTNGAPTQNPGAQGQEAAGAQGQAPQTAVARPDGWRKSMLRAAPIARAMGIDTKGKRLAQVVAEIDARDTQTPTTPAPQPAPGPVRIGRDNTPLNEGGKPFKTRKAAGDAKKLQPMMRVVSVEGGYALAEKTPAQLAAEARAARRLAQPRTGTAGAPLAAHEFIAAEGGLSSVAAADLGVDGNPRIGNRRLFAGRGRGMSMEQATEKLIADGYLGEGATLNDAYALIKTSLTRPQYNADGIERIAEAEAQTQFEDYLAAQEEAAADGNADPFGVADSFTAEELDDVGYTDADPALQAEVNALIVQADAMGIDTYAILDDIARTYADATQDEFNAKARDALAAAIARGNQDGGSAAAQAAPAAEPAQEPGLTAPTRADIEAQQEARNKAEREEAARQRAADQAASQDENRKRIAQASVRAAAEFELWQDPLDSLTGQGSMFDDAPEQPQKSPSATEPVAQPITRADVTAAQQQATTLIAERLDAMTAGEVNTIARRFLPTMGVKPTVSKERNKAAVTDFTKVNPMAAAAEFGVTLPADVRLALDAEMQGMVVDEFVGPAAANQAPANDRNTFTLQRLNRDTDQMEPVTFERGEYVRYTVGGKDQFGDIDGISQARKEFSVDGLWYPFGFAYKAERPAAPKADAVPLSSVIDKMNAKNGQGLTDADRVPEQKPASKTPTVDRHNAAMAAVREGKATAEQFRASFEQVADGKAAIVAELDTMTKAQLLREGGPFVQMRYANEKKAAVVDAVYREMVGEYALGESVTYGMGRDSYQNAVRKLVEATDADKLAQYVADRKAAAEEYAAQRAAKAAALENPQSLTDYRSLIQSRINEGKTRKEAFLMLTPEQRIQYDTLEAESTKEARESRKRTAKTEVRAAGQTTGGEIIATKHTRDGYDLFVVKLADRLSKEDYSTVLASAKKLGGWYSAFRGNGAIPGFQFKDKANAEAFLSLAGGDTTAAQEQVAQRRDAFEDDRSQTAVERLRAMADKLEEGASEVEGQERKTNTARRARFASAAMASAAADKAKAKTMRNIAQAIEDGNAKFLDAVRTKSQVDMLTGIVDTAKGAELRAKYPSYADQQKRKGEPPTAETADFAEFPSYSAFRSDLATLGRQLLEVDGTKKLGQRLMSVADDVTDAYLEFAKANIQQVSQFGRGDALAEFASKDEAERAIKRSGLTGKAIVLPIKRGQNRVILSPSEAIGRGLWQGDGDKRITLTAEFGAELVESIGRRGNKQNKLSVPWQFQNAYDRRKALSRIGIETPSEFRAALREFISLKEQAIANRTRELELQMVGRKADGLDFFPTSAEVADQMIEAADLTQDMAVLEPSAGMGHLADRIRDAGAEPDVIEISADRRALLEEKGYTTQAVDDFLDLKPREFYTFGDTFRAPDGVEGIMRGANGNRVKLVNQAGDMVGAGYYDRADLTGVAHNGTASGYDRIIMNPPFSNRRDAEHVRHAYSLLKPGGRIVAIMGEGVFFGQDKKAQDFREWLESVGGTSEKLPEGSFMDPSLPVNTSVNARMVVIDKADGAAMFSRTPAAQAAIGTPAATIRASITKAYGKLLGQLESNGLVTLTQTQEQAIEAAAQARADKTGKPLAEVRASLMGSVSNSVATDDLDIRRSANGAIQGFFDPQTGQSFLISDNLTAEAAPGVLMHEVGIHMAADGSMKALFNRAAMMLKLQRGNPFIKQVQARMDAAGETSGEEAAAYIAEAYENDRANAPASVQRWLADLLAAVKAWMFKKGIMGADRLTVADIAAVARANARSMARDGGATGGQGFGPAFSHAPAGDQTQTEAFKRWFAGSKVVDADGKPLRVYHGTRREFSIFEPMKPRAAYGNPVGIYFTDDINEAKEFSEDIDGATDERSRVVHAYLSIQSDSDGIIRKRKDGTTEYIVFKPEKIKSAIGNNGDFDPSNPDIRFSRAGVSNTGGQATTGWDAPTPTGFDDVIYKLQDKNIDLKRVVESITKATGKVADSINAYLKEELFHKRAAKRVADFGDRELKPLMNKMRLAGLSMEDVEEYLHARHAKEANAVIAQRNPGNAGLQDGGSGMTNAAADNYFAKLDPAQRRKLEAVAKSVDAIIDGTRKLYVDYGLEDQAVVDGWANMYQHYIPLMREDKDGGMGIGQGFSVKGKETKGRTGSTRKVVDILANVAMQREKLIVRGEKNIVAQALVGLAQANPNPDFWEVRSQAPTERVFDPKTGVVVDRPDPLFKSRENVAVAKVKDANGKVTEQMVVFNEDNPRAVRMAAAMKNLDAGNLEGLLGVSAKITRYFAAINTQYNPVFGVVNLVRDVQGAMVNLGTTPLAGQQGKIAKDTLSALRGIYGDIRKTRKGGQATSQWSQLWEQMQDDGGTTGYRDLFKTSADRANDLKSILNPEGWMDSKWGKFFTADGRLKVPLSMAQKGATEIFGWLSDYNEAMENGVRLAAYKAALDKGMSREQAASLAKNLTVNFNRKGQAGMQAGAVYAFFNAAMQGTARIGQTLFDMDGGDLSTLRLSKTGKAVVYGGVILGVMQALALAAAGFDDDDPPEFLRERSLIIPLGGKLYFNIPMPLGLHVIPGIGRHATEFALSGFDKPAKRAVAVVGMFADAFNPIGNAGLSMQTIAPTALDPLAALTENKDSFGRTIARVSSNKALPGHTQWKDTATGFSKVVAEAINWISGGNEYVAGAFSPTPDQIDYLLAQVGGGVAREAAKVQQTITTAMSGETLPTHKIPLVGRFVGNAASQASQGSAFYANLNKLNELETEIKGLRKDGRFDEASKLTRENPQSILIAMANRAERDVQRLRREKRELIANDASREQVRAKEDQITDVMTRLNEAVERRKAQAAR